MTSQGYALKTRPVWHALSIGFAALSVGMTLSLAPAYVFTLAGEGSIVATAFGAGAMMFVAIAVAAFSKHFVVGGSLMSFVRMVFGGWAPATVGSALLLGYIAMIPSATAATQVFVVGGLSDLGFTAAGSSLAQSIAVLAILCVSAFVAQRGLDASVWVTTVLGYACVPPVMYLVGAAVFNHHVELSSQASHVVGDGDSWFSMVTNGAIVSMIFLLGFEGISTVAAETKDPHRSIPVVLVTLVGVVGTLAVVATWVQLPILVYGSDDLAQGLSPVALLAREGKVEFLRAPVDFVLILSGVAALVAVLNYAARIMATAASDGLLPRWIGRYDSSTGAPARAIVLLTTLAAIVLVVPTVVTGAPPVLIGTYFASTVVYCWLIPYFLTCVGAIRLELRAERRPAIIICSAMGALTMGLLVVRTLVLPPAGSLAWVPFGVYGAVAAGSVWFMTRSKRGAAINF